MAVSVYKGARVSGATTTIHSGPGWFLGFLISHGQGTAQTVTIYNNTSGSGTILVQVTQPPNVQPLFVWFPESIEFDRGLTVVAPANVEVNVWAKGR